MKKNKKKKQNKTPKNFKGIFMATVIIVIATLYLINVVKTENKSFDFMNLEWRQGIFDGEEVFHTTLPSGEEDQDLYLKNDPRTNYIQLNKSEDSLKRKVYISTSKEFESCLLDAPRIKDNLKLFMEEVMGREEVIFKTTDADWALETNNTSEYKTCTNSYKESVILLEIGDGSVGTHPSNSMCYIIQMRDCKDIKPIEQLMLSMMLAK